MPSLDRMPDTLGPYRLLERIGAGGMGAVYLARDPADRQVAVKVLHSRVVAEEPAARRRLAREVEMMRRVRSPFVAEVLDADVTGPWPYIVTRYVPGRTLDDVVRSGGPLPPRALERLGYGLAEALAAVHAAGVVHRDLKPGNVMLSGDGPVVIDFGIAHTPDATRLTQTGMFMGTPGYLAPEVIEGQPSSTASDVHSWGATMAFAATGRPPFGSGSFESIFFRIVGGRADLDGIPGPLLALVSSAMARDPRDRPTAATLCARCAALDLAAAAPPGGAAAHVAGAAQAAGGAARAAAGQYGRAAAGAGVAVLGAAGATVADPGLAGSPATYRRGTRTLPDPDAAAGFDDFADILPPARYEPRSRATPRQTPWGGVDAGDAIPAGDGGVPAPAARPGPAVGAAVPYGATYRRARPHRLLTLAAMVIALAVSAMLPIAGMLVSVAAITLLRAADRAQSTLTVRRSVRGPSVTDPLVALAAAPWTVARSLLTTVLLAPVALLVAAVAAVATLVSAHTDPLALAGSYAAAALVGCYAIGPGSGGPRRALNRFFGTFTRTRGGAIVSTVVMCSLAAAAIVAAGSQPPLYWPSISGLLPHLPNLSSAIQVDHVHLWWVNIPRMNLPSVQLPQLNLPGLGG